jgi:hypothetical protein
MENKEQVKNIATSLWLVAGVCGLFLYAYFMYTTLQTLGIVRGVIYTTSLTGLGLYLVSVISAIVSIAVVTLQADKYEINPKDPQRNKLGDRFIGLIREMRQYEIVVVGRSKRPAFPVFSPGAQKITVNGLQRRPTGMATTRSDDWVVSRVKKGGKYENIIQSKYGWFSPLFMFRKGVFRFTGKHVVRVKFPFFAFGIFTYYEPITHKFKRLKTRDLQEVEKKVTMQLVKDFSDINKMVVVDVSDHVMFESALTFMTSAFPTTQGYEVQYEIALTLQSYNLDIIVSWEDWSTQMETIVNNFVGPYIRGGTLDNRYAGLVENESGESLTKLIFNYLTKPLPEDGGFTLSKDRDGKEISTMETLGWRLVSVAINNVYSPDKGDINKLLVIKTEGDRVAYAGQQEIAKSVEALKDADESTKSALGIITAARSGKSGRTDLFISQGGPQATPDTAYIKRVSQNTEKETNEGGEE